MKRKQELIAKSNICYGRTKPNCSVSVRL